MTKDEARLNIDDIKKVENSNNLRVRGWSINPSGVKSVQILIDGKFKNYAVIGLLRRDVKDAYPSYPNADNSGFEYEIEVAELANGDHTVTAITRGNDGSYAQQRMGFSVNSSNSGSEVTGLTMTASFFGGIKDAIADNVQGIWKLITNLKQIPGLVEFAVKASMDDTEEHQILQGMVLGELVDMSLKYSYGDRNVKARFFGRAVGEIIIALAGFKGIPKALEALEGVSKVMKLETVIGKISKGAKAEEVVSLIETSYVKSIDFSKLGTGNVGDFSDLKGTTIDDILSRIPNNATKRELTPIQGKVQEGFEYKFVENGETMRVRVHGPDQSAPIGSNARDNWIVRVQKGKKYMDSSGKFHPPGVSNPNSDFYDENIIDDTHIPIISPK